MSELADQVAALEERLHEAECALEEYREQNGVLDDQLKDAIASLNSATREIDELYDQLKYLQELCPEGKTAWQVKQKMEND